MNWRVGACPLDAQEELVRAPLTLVSPWHDRLHMLVCASAVFVLVPCSAAGSDCVLFVHNPRMPRVVVNPAKFPCTRMYLSLVLGSSFMWYNDEQGCNEGSPGTRTHI